MTFSRRLALLAAAVLSAVALIPPAAAVAANAQVQGYVVTACPGAASYTPGTFTYATVDVHGTVCTGVSVTATAVLAVAPVTTTQSGGTVTTHGTFQSALASSGARQGCTLQNTSADLEYVFFGATGSATTSNSYQLGAGQSLNCAVGGLAVATDNIAITSKTTDGATFVVGRQ